MKKSLFFAFAAVILAASCQRTLAPEQEGPAYVKIEPIITRATSTNFESGDKVGVTIVKGETTHADNACLTYSEEDQAFSSDLKWYADGGESCTIKAFYPYQDGGFPTQFTVASDQSRGAGVSDFMVAAKSDVYPQKAGVAMQFKHYMTQLVVNITNQAGADIESVTFKNLKCTADIAVDGEGVITVTPAAVETSDVIAEPLTAGLQYRGIVVPQTIQFGMNIKVKGGNVLVTNIPESTLKQGYTYTITAEVTPDNVKVSFAGEIQNWEQGDPLTPVVIPFKEYLDDGYFEYDNVRYSVARMADGKWWMTSNLRFVPLGYTPSDNLNNVTAGVYYPVVMGTGKVEFSKDAADIAANGYLYQTELALGVKVNSIKTVAAAQALNGAQGICPMGWHIPTDEDMIGLIGKIASYSYPAGFDYTKAPYYDSATSNASIAKLNEDNFNADAWGAVTINDNTKTAASLMGYLKDYENVNSGYLCGSTYASCTYYTTGDETSGLKNVQFWGLMPMVKNGTFNGSKLSYKIGATVRCVRNK